MNPVDAQTASMHTIPCVDSSTDPDALEDYISYLEELKYAFGSYSEAHDPDEDTWIVFSASKLFWSPY